MLSQELSQQSFQGSSQTHYSLASLLTQSLRERLRVMDQLCPGDFAAVKRQSTILDSEPGAEEFVEQLEAEHRIKPEVRENRGMGFLQ